MSASGKSIGFDLDMTLVDTRPGIHAALLALAADTGRHIDADAIVATLGPPVATALAPYVPPDEMEDAIAVFREHMARVGVMNVVPLPGAHKAISAARGAGYRVVVVTSKILPLALSTLQHAGLDVDAVYGDVWAAAKANPLRGNAAIAYAGDHPDDMIAANKASATAIGVTSGSAPADDLHAAGADVVLKSLEDFPAWLHHL